MAEFTDLERELIAASEEPSAVQFRQICESMSDEMLFACLRIIVPVAQRRGLVAWFAESESVQ